MRRRDFIMLFGGAAAWPLATRAQNPGMPVVALVSSRSREASARNAAAFRKGLNEDGYVEGQNVMVEYIGCRPNTIACRRSWPISCAVRWR